MTSYCIRGPMSMNLFGGRCTIEYGKVCFVENGKEYDLNKIMKGKNPTSGANSIHSIPNGIHVAGVDLKYPEDFLPQDEVPWAETLSYREEQRQRDLQREREHQQREREREQRELQRERERQQREREREQRECE